MQSRTDILLGLALKAAEMPLSISGGRLTSSLVKFACQSTDSDIVIEPDRTHAE